MGHIYYLQKCRFFVKKECKNFCGLQQAAVFAGTFGAVKSLIGPGYQLVRIATFGWIHGRQAKTGGEEGLAGAGVGVGVAAVAGAGAMAAVAAALIAAVLATAVASSIRLSQAQVRQVKPLNGFPYSLRHDIGTRRICLGQDDGKFIAAVTAG